MSNKMMEPMLSPEECWEIRRAKKVAQYQALNSHEKRLLLVHRKKFQYAIKPYFEQKAKIVLSKFEKDSPEYCLATQVLSGDIDYCEIAKYTKINKAVIKADHLLEVDLQNKDLLGAVNAYFKNKLEG